MLTKDQQKEIAAGLVEKFPNIPDETVNLIGDLVWRLAALPVSSDAEYLMEVAGDETKDSTVRSAASYCLSVISGVGV